MAAIVQPNYVYNLDQAATDQAPAAPGDTGQQGDAAQYILEKLKMLDVHRIVRGANVTIAVIDSEIDATHPGLIGVVAQRFSAVGAPGAAPARPPGWRTLSPPTSGSWALRLPRARSSRRTVVRYAAVELGCNIRHFDL